jgi:adenylate cyclase
LLLLVGLLAAYGLMARRVKNRFYLYVGMALCLAIVAYSYNLALKSEDGLVYDGASLDLAIQYRLAAPTASDDIVIIDIDERSLADLAPDYGRWPWPRDVIAELLLALEDQGAESIALNVMFSDPDINNPQADEVLNTVACELKKTTFPMTRLAPQNDEMSAINLSMIPGILKTAGAIDQNIALLIPFLPCAHDKMSLNNLVVDDDGLVRRAKEYWNESGYLLPTLAGEALKALPRRENAEASQNAFLLNWRNRSDEGYRRISFSDVYRALVLRDQTELPRESIKGKHFIIGASAPGLAVLKGTSLGPTTDDNEIIATMIDDLISGTGLIPIDIWTNAMISCAFVLILSFLFGRGLDEDAADVFFIVLEFAAVGITILSVSYFSVVVDLSAPAAAGVILFSIVKIHQYAESNSRKGIGIFGPTPHPSGTVRVVQSRNDDEDAIKELESHFGLNNVIEVDQLIQDSNILSDVLIESRYLFVFSDLEAWTTFYGDTDAFIEDFELVGETQRSVGVEDEQTEWRLLMARLASICLDHYASAFISKGTE